MMETVAVAVSGGIDSLMTAWLLKQEGKSVFGVHFITGYESAGLRENTGNGNGGDPDAVAAFISDSISIPVTTVDLRETFQSRVVNYFIDAYQTGLTPNPCMVCNPLVKFGALLEIVREMGADLLATGHYARIIDCGDGRRRLLKGADPQKDQSYFLAFLSQNMLQHARFPLGSEKKQSIMETAAENGLKSHRPSESQDVCFVRNQSYAEFLELQPQFERRPGLIENTQGDVIGEHKGLHLFTIGQRKGINCPAERPYYVVRIDMRRNRLVVGFKEDLTVKGFRMKDMNWIIPRPEVPFEASVRVRYRSEAVPAKIYPEADGYAAVSFLQPHKAVTPGQGGVLYDGCEVLGGGFIVG